MATRSDEHRGGRVRRRSCALLLALSVGAGTLGAHLAPLPADAEPMTYGNHDLAPLGVGTPQAISDNGWVALSKWTADLPKVKDGFAIARLGDEAATLTTFPTQAVPRAINNDRSVITQSPDPVTKDMGVFQAQSTFRSTQGQLKVAKTVNKPARVDKYRIREFNNRGDLLIEDDAVRYHLGVRKPDFTWEWTTLVKGFRPGDMNDVGQVVGKGNDGSIAIFSPASGYKVILKAKTSWEYATSINEAGMVGLSTGGVWNPITKLVLQPPTMAGRTKPSIVDITDNFEVLWTHQEPSKAWDVDYQVITRRTNMLTNAEWEVARGAKYDSGTSTNDWVYFIGTNLDEVGNVLTSETWTFTRTVRRPA